jgi:monoamine oxidase
VREQREATRGRFRRINSFADAQRAVHGAELERDVSFQAFLQHRRLPAKTKTFARMMVEGFDAADPRRVSARSIIEEWGGAEMGASQPRPQGGYGALFDWLANSVVASGVRLRLGAEVTRLSWKHHVATVSGKFGSAKAPRVIVTLPLGVLQAGPLRFREKSGALRRLASGPVIRVAMRFHEAFWEKRARSVAFFHSPAAPFPTIWTPLPMRAPLLTAWAGGPKASRLTGSSSARLLDAALASVDSIFGKNVRALLAAAHVQDWMQDPHSRGGYSYLLVGGEGAREELATPLDDTVFFAGEATDREEAGTVAGALRSGIRAARQVMR